MKIKAFRTIILTCVFVKPIYAQELLTLERTLTIAYENNIAMIESRKEVELSKAGLVHAKLYPNPEINIESYTLPFQIGIGASNIEGGLSQEIEILGKRDTRIKIAQDEIDIFNERLNLVWTEIAFEVKNEYIELLLKQKKKELAKENLSLVQKFSDSIQLKYKSGQALLNEVIRAKIEVSRIENELLIAEKELSITKARLNLLLNRPFNHEFDAIDELTYKEKRLVLDELVKKALERNPELKIKILLLSQKNKELVLAKKEGIPNPKIGMLGKQEEYEKYFGISFGLSLPVWYRNQGIISQTKIESEKIEKAIEYLKKGLELKINEIFIESELADKQVNLFRQNIEQSNELLRVIDLQYKEGKINFLTYLENLITVRKTKVEYYETILNYRQKIASIEKIINE